MFTRHNQRGISLIELIMLHRSHGPCGNTSVVALRPVPQERHNCVPTLERGNDSCFGPLCEGYPINWIPACAGMTGFSRRSRFERMNLPGMQS